MIDGDFYITLCLLAFLSAALAVLILFILSKPFKSLIYILKSRKVRAEILNVSVPSENGAPPVFTPLALYKDESGSYALILRKEDFLSYGKNLLRDGKKLTVFADENGFYTTLYHFFRTLIQTVLLAAMPVLLFIGSAGMLYSEITSYHVISRILNKL